MKCNAVLKYYPEGFCLGSKVQNVMISDVFTSHFAAREWSQTVTSTMLLSERFFLLEHKQCVFDCVWFVIAVCVKGVVAVYRRSNGLVTVFIYKTLKQCNGSIKMWGKIKISRSHLKE